MNWQLKNEINTLSVNLSDLMIWHEIWQRNVKNKIITMIILILGFSWLIITNLKFNIKKWLKRISNLLEIEFLF